jgi:hypothetical protein
VNKTQDDLLVFGDPADDMANVKLRQITHLLS